MGLIQGGFMERTFVAIKPDAVMRGLIGEIIRRFENTGLRIVAMKMMMADEEKIKKTYHATDKWRREMGEKTLKSYKEFKKDPLKELGTSNALEIGKLIEGWIYNYWKSGPIVVMVVAGNHAVKNVRMLIGYTVPTDAPPGTIRGDYSIDSPILANLRKRPIKNLLHASGSLEEAEMEINNWFTEKEILNYQRADHAVMFD